MCLYIYRERGVLVRLRLFEWMLSAASVCFGPGDENSCFEPLILDSDTTPARCSARQPPEVLRLFYFICRLLHGVFLMSFFGLCLEFWHVLRKDACTVLR